MSTEREKKTPAVPTGKQYSSVEALLSGEGVAPDVRAKFSELKHDTVIVDNLVQMRQAAELSQQKLGEVAGVVDEAVTGVRVVKGFGQEERELQRLIDE